MAYWEWGDPANPHVVLCVHGLSRQGRDFDVLAEYLSDEVRVVCPDVVGRGRSDWLQDPMGYQIPQYAADMLTLLTHLQQQCPIATLDWVGTSMGGLIGMAIAGHHANCCLPREGWPFRFAAARCRRDVGDLDKFWPAHTRAMAGVVTPHGQACARRHQRERDAALRPGYCAGGPVNH